MKYLLSAVVFAFIGCSSNREIQADFVNAKLVKIETVSRWKDYEKKLTWKCSNNIEMISFVPFATQMVLGANYKVLMAK